MMRNEMNIMKMKKISRRRKIWLKKLEEFQKESDKQKRRQVQDTI